MAKRVEETAWRHEHAALVKSLRARRPAVRHAAVARICELFEPLVKAQARSCQQSVCGGELEDLEQVARMGLLDAINTFKPTRGAFPSHAMWTIRNALSKYVESLGNPVALPAWMIRRVSKLKRVATQLAQELQRPPTRTELAARMQMPVTAIETMQAYISGPVELDEGYATEE